MEYWFHGDKMQVNKNYDQIDNLTKLFDRLEKFPPGFIGYKRLVDAIRSRHYPFTFCKIVPGKIISEDDEKIIAKEIVSVKGGYDLRFSFEFFCRWCSLQMIKKKEFPELILAAIKESMPLERAIAIGELHNLFENATEELEKSIYGVVYYSYLYLNHMEYRCWCNPLKKREYVEEKICVKILDYVEKVTELLDDETFTMDIVTKKLEKLFDMFML